MSNVTRPFRLSFLLVFGWKHEKRFGVQMVVQHEGFALGRHWSVMCVFPD